MKPAKAMVEMTRGTGLALGIGGACGVASAAFLHALDWVTYLRTEHPALPFALPLAGLAIGLFYERYGRSIQRGNDLIIDTIHDGGPKLPTRLAPMVLIGTLLTHLFGGSAGREGTAVQMGAGISDGIAHWAKVSPELRRLLLSAGVAGGFGAVFGTPFAGALFGLEFVVLGRLRTSALVPSLTAALVGDHVTRTLGVVHATYPSPAPLAFEPWVAAKWTLFALAISGVTIAFIELTHRLRDEGRRRVRSLPVRMALAGASVVVLWQVVGTDAYLGLGVPTLMRAFGDPALPSHAFALKVLFTALTLGGGFLGGEVTPLFFIGATLGATCGRVLGLPLDLAAAVGMAATFGAASNTPLALSLMCVELCSATTLPHVAWVSALAYVLVGHRSIYRAQRIAHGKLGQDLGPLPLSLHSMERPKEVERPEG
jgi:H+/Cl- antiporter ClcA